MSEKETVTNEEIINLLNEIMKQTDRESIEKEIPKHFENKDWKHLKTLVDKVVKYEKIHSEIHDYFSFIKREAVKMNNQNKEQGEEK